MDFKGWRQTSGVPVWVPWAILGMLSAASNGLSNERQLKLQALTMPLCKKPRGRQRWSPRCQLFPSGAELQPSWLQDDRCSLRCHRPTRQHPKHEGNKRETQALTIFLLRMKNVFGSLLANFPLHLLAQTQEYVSLPKVKD